MIIVVPLSVLSFPPFYKGAADFTKGWCSISCKKKSKSKNKQNLDPNQLYINLVIVFQNTQSELWPFKILIGQNNYNFLGVVKFGISASKRKIKVIFFM